MEELQQKHPTIYWKLQKYCNFTCINFINRVNATESGTLVTLGEPWPIKKHSSPVQQAEEGPKFTPKNLLETIFFEFSKKNWPYIVVSEFLQVPKKAVKT